jgi:hypothetical protein
MSEATHLRLKSLSAAHTDENEHEHQQVGDSCIVCELAYDPCDLAPGLGKIGSAVGHSVSSVCFNAFISVLSAWLALSVRAGRFVFDELRPTPPFVVFAGARIVLRFAPPDLAPGFLLFFFTVMRRCFLTMMTTPKCRCQFEN